MVTWSEWVDFPQKSISPFFLDNRNFCFFTGFLVDLNNFPGSLEAIVWWDKKYCKMELSKSITYNFLVKSLKERWKGHSFLLLFSPLCLLEYRGLEFGQSSWNIGVRHSQWPMKLAIYQGLGIFITITMAYHTA